jgi:hypothetical protein
MTVKNNNKIVAGIFFRGFQRFRNGVNTFRRVSQHETFLRSAQAGT